MDRAEMVPMHSREVLVDVARRMLALHAAGTTTLADEVMVRPPSAYRDPDRWRKEREVLFGLRPVPAALSVDVPDPGCRLPLTVAGRTVVLVRGDDGRVRAFRNMCRHRGAPVAEEAGCSRALTCRYHGWTYDTRGTLVGIPGAEGFAGMDPAGRGLVPLPCVERSGMIWITTDPDARTDLDEAIAPVAAELAHLGLDQLVPMDVREVPVAANWHLVLDTSTESYHFGALHRQSIGAVTISNLNVLDTFGDAQRVTYAGATLPSLAGTSEEAWAPEDHVQFVYLLFPNAALVITSADVVGLLQAMPGDAVGSSTARLSTYSRRSTAHEPREVVTARCTGFWQVVVEEDLPMAEAIERAMGSTRHDEMVFGRNEPALQGLHKAYDRVLGTPA